MNTQVKKLLRGKKACSPCILVEEEKWFHDKGAVKIGQAIWPSLQGCVDDGCKKDRLQGDSNTFTQWED